MTSDAKIGLLLGLLFIFIIAFIINGLPNFRDDGDDNELTTTMVNFDGSALGVASRERTAQETLDWREVVEAKSLDLGGAPLDLDDFQRPSLDDDDVRSVTELPKRPLTAWMPTESTEEQSEADSSPSSVVTVADDSETDEPKPVMPRVRVYVVEEGDNLASIAKKLYGADEGNRRATVTQIFDANRKLLSSPDEISVGQKLVIPPLRTAASDRKVRSVLSEVMFEKVKSIGRKHLPNSTQGAEQTESYVVREGDSLWKIAAAQLGSGSRYGEIAKLNAGILKDEDTVVVGMRLRMPTR
ncbi:MAG: LysM peptidoglycan-binding domain-containing protein [Phycisphaerales bacterium]|nr:MAG: LysM peptidoglycan-binding domain-containing protein [Phycisphaerales bacterium]